MSETISKGAGVDIGAQVVAGLIFIVTVMAAVLGFGETLIAKVAVARLVATGPLFIACALFGATRRYLFGWLSQGMNYLTLFALIITVFELVLALKQQRWTSTDGQANAEVAGMLFCALCILGAIFFLQTPAIAAGIAGGAAAGRADVSAAAGGLMSGRAASAAAPAAAAASRAGGGVSPSSPTGGSVQPVRSAAWGLLRWPAPLPFDRVQGRVARFLRAVRRPRMTGVVSPELKPQRSGSWDLARAGGGSQVQAGLDHVERARGEPLGQLLPAVRSTSPQVSWGDAGQAEVEVRAVSFVSPP